MLALLIGLIAGIASPVQASINAEARRFFRSPFIIAVYNFMLAWLCLAGFLLVTDHGLHIPLASIAKNPPWIWAGGVCAIIIVTMNILCVPKLGAAGNVMILNFGQILTGLVIDHFALFGADEVRMTATRFIGAVMVMAGMMLVTAEKGEGAEGKRSMPLLYVLLSFFCGVACSVQIAANGTLRLVVDSVAKATLVSMSVAFTLTVCIMVILVLLKGKQGLFDRPCGEERAAFRPRMMSGGLFALIVVSSNAAVAPVLGTGLASIMNLIGMLGMGLVIDAAGLLSTEKKPVTFRKIAGMLLMLAGTAIISFL